MAAAMGIWAQHQASHALVGAQPVPLAGPAGGGSGNSGGTSDSGGDATISANDFLTLLVTEMQNQDPTDDTDPNEYIDQLVQVNSLEQLIDINQNLSTALGISSSSSDAAQGPASEQVPGSQVPGAAAGVTPMTSTGAPSVAHPAAHKGSALGQVQSAAASAATASTAAAHGSSSTRHAPGNLSIPEVKPAARRVAEALGGQPRSQ
jgi:flagellar basal-body rod modification protein FlgD